MQARRVPTYLPTTLAACCLFALNAPQPVAAQTQAQSFQTISYEIDAGTLESVLNKFATQSKMQVIYSPELVAGKSSTGLSGKYSHQQALVLLLKNKEIAWKLVGKSMYVLSDQGKTKATVPPAAKTIRESPGKRGEAAGAPIATDMPDVVVVGSRLGMSPVETAMPIRVITREQIDSSGAGNIAQVLSNLSEVSLNNSGDRPIGSANGIEDGGSTNSTTIQIRGLFRGSVLVLINGRRAGTSAYSDTGQFDLSTIPLALVERIEVLPSGSSAIYGGDGLAGVINVVTRRDANGLELRTRYSAADGYDTKNASVLWGRSWKRGEITAAFTWSDEGDLLSGERAITASQDYRRYGGSDYRDPSSNPVNVYSLEGCAASGPCFTPLSNRGNLPGLDSPIAGAPTNSDGIGLTFSDFVQTQGALNATSSSLHFRSAEKNFGVTTSGRFDLAKNLELSADLTYTRRDVPAYELPLGSYIAQYGYPISRLPAENPFNPFGVDVAVGYKFTNTGIFTSYNSDHARASLSLRGSVSRYRWESSIWRSKDRAGSSGATHFNEEAIIAALNSTNPDTALNVFVSNGQAPGSPELMRSLSSLYASGSESINDGASIHLQGEAFNLPAGPIVALVGGEWQRNRLDFDSDSVYAVHPTINGTSISRAIFAETRAPVLRASAGQARERIVATAAVRRETSDRFDEAATTETIGLEFRPSRTVLLRGTHSTAFRPLLTFLEVRNPLYRQEFIVDPLNGQAYMVSTRSGGGHRSDLMPETSKNTTFGIVYKPEANWGGSVTYWDTDIANRIVALSAYAIVMDEGAYPDRVQRDPETGLVREVDVRELNLALSSTAGLDIDIHGGLSAGVGQIEAGLAATYTRKYIEQANVGGSVEDGVSQLRPTGWAPRWKIVPRVTWTTPAATATLIGRYVSKYRDSLPLSTGPNAGKFRTLGDFWIINLNVDLAIGRLFGEKSHLAETRLSIGANNLFNSLPKYCAGCFSVGYDASQYDIVGRNIYAELRMSF